MLTEFKDSKNVLMFDLSNVAFISYFSRFTSGNHVESFFERVVDLMDRNDYSNMSMVFVLDHKSKKRLALYPEYKGQRPKIEFDPRPDVIRMVRYFRCAIAWNEDEEADDVMASICAKYSNKNFVVVTSDKDLYQMGGFENVTLFNPMKVRNIDLQDCFKDFGLEDWDLVALWKTIFGDTSDNIKPIASRIIKKHVMDYVNSCDGTPSGFYKVLLKNYDKINKKTWDKIMNKDAEIKMAKNWDLVKLGTSLPYKLTECRGNDRFLKVFLGNKGCAKLMERTNLVTGGCNGN